MHRLNQVTLPCPPMKPGGASMQILPTVIRYMCMEKPGRDATRFWPFQALRCAWVMSFHFPDACLAALLLPVIYWAKHLGLEDHSPVRPDFSPKRESKSPGPPKLRSRVRYKDGEKQLRQQHQYAASGIGSSSSRSSKSSRRSLVCPFCISADDGTQFTSTLV